MKIQERGVQIQIQGYIKRRESEFIGGEAPLASHINTEKYFHYEHVADVMKTAMAKLGQEFSPFLAQPPHKCYSQFTKFKGLFYTVVCEIFIIKYM